MDAVIAIETDLNAIVKEVFILTAVSKTVVLLQWILLKL